MDVQVGIYIYIFINMQENQCIDKVSWLYTKLHLQVLVAVLVGFGVGRGHPIPEDLESVKILRP